MCIGTAVRSLHTSPFTSLLISFPAVFLKRKIKTRVSGLWVYFWQIPQSPTGRKLCSLLLVIQWRWIPHPVSSQSGTPSAWDSGFHPGFSLSVSGQIHISSPTHKFDKAQEGVAYLWIVGQMPFHILPFNTGIFNAVLPSRRTIWYYHVRDKGKALVNCRKAIVLGITWVITTLLGQQSELRDEHWGPRPSLLEEF